MAEERDDPSSVAVVKADADAEQETTAPSRGALLEFLDEALAYVIGVLVFPLAALLALVALGSWAVVMIAFTQVWSVVQPVLASLGVSADALAAAKDIIAWVAFLVAGIVAFVVTRWSWRRGKQALLGARARVHDRAAAMRAGRRGP